MADEQLESGPDIEELKAPPMPEISQVSGDERTSPQAVDTAALEALIERKFADLNDGLEKRMRGLQSGVDKRLAVADPMKLAKYLKVSPEALQAAQREAVMDDIVEERLSSPQPDRGTVSKAETKDTAVILAEVKADLGVEIAPDDPDLIKAAKAKSYGSWDAWRAEVMKLGARKAKQGTISPSAVVAETPQRPPAVGTALEAAQQKMMRLQNDPKSSIKDLETATKEYREALSRQR